VHIPHRGFDGVVPGDVLQRKSVPILPSPDQKRVAESVKSGIGIGFDFITQPAHLVPIACSERDPLEAKIYWLRSWVPPRNRFGKDRSVLGPLLETHAFAEVVKPVDWLAETSRLYPLPR
jgi:hypothetical protein